MIPHSDPTTALLAFLAGVSVALSLGAPSELIFGGTRAVQGQFPSHVYVLYTKASNGVKYGCGGTLLSSRHVLTAGHCTVTLTDPSIVAVGLTDEEDFDAEGVQVSNVTKYFRHPGYPGSDLKDDVAILEISPEIRFTDVVKPIKIARDDADLLLSGHATVTGFGTYKIENGWSMSSRYLLHADVPLVEREWCATEWFDYSKGIVTISENQICAGATNKGVGSGDSGGGLQVLREGEWRQIGVDSFVASNITVMADQARVPGVYARIAPYCDYIANVTSNAFQCD